MQQQVREKGFAHIGLIIAVIVVVAAVTFAGWWVWDKNKDDKNSDNKNNTSQEKEPETSQEPKIPEGYTVYDNQEYGFSFAYPEELGSLATINIGDSTVLVYAKSADTQNAFAPYTSSSLDVKVSKKDGFLTRAGKYGPILEFNNGKWVVTGKEGGDILNAGHAIGSEYEAAVARTINGVPVYDFSAGDEGCYWTNWVFQVEGAFVAITLPSVCADEIDTIPQDRIAAYKKVTDKVLATLTID